MLNFSPALFVVADIRQWKAVHQLWKHDDKRFTHQPLGGRTGMQKQSQNEQVHPPNHVSTAAIMLSSVTLIINLNA